MLRCAIFDMDGLLIDSEPIWQKAQTIEFGAVGIQLTPSLCATTSGLRIDAVVRHWHSRIGWSGPTQAQMADNIVERVIELILEDALPKEGVDYIIDFFSSRHFSLAIASSSPKRLIEAVVRKLEIGDRLVLIQSAEFEKAGKPAPDIYLSTLNKLGAKASECLAFEDSSHGVTAALRAGIRCVCVPDPSSGTPAPTHATMTIPSLAAFNEAKLAELAGTPEVES
jgi:sugar-phosphatase